MLGGLHWWAQLRNNGSNFFSSFNQQRRSGNSDLTNPAGRDLVFWSLNH
jgi:hypothetical protein